MKKYLFMNLLGFSLILNSVVIPVNASFVSEIPETSLEDMYKKASQQAASYSLDDNEEITVTLTDNQEGTVVELAGFKAEETESSETYVMAVPTELLNESSVSTYASGSGSDSGYDESYSVYASITYNYNTKTSNGTTGYLLTGCSGSWQIKDSSVSLSNREVIFACTGPILGGGMSLYQY